jgi:hypothetical protein
MALERMLCAIWLPIRIDVQHDPSDLTPVGALGVSIEQP